MVSEVSGRLLSGIDNKHGKKAVKYSIAFDGLLPCDSILSDDPAYGSEDVALPEVVRSHIKQDLVDYNPRVICATLIMKKLMRSLS